MVDMCIWWVLAFEQLLHTACANEKVHILGWRGENL